MLSFYGGFTQSIEYGRCFHHTAVEREPAAWPDLFETPQSVQRRLPLLTDTVAPLFFLLQLSLHGRWRGSNDEEHHAFVYRSGDTAFLSHEG